MTPKQNSKKNAEEKINKHFKIEHNFGRTFSLLLLNIYLYIFSEDRQGLSKSICITIYICVYVYMYIKFICISYIHIYKYILSTRHRNWVFRHRRFFNFSASGENLNLSKTCFELIFI